MIIRCLCSKLMLLNINIQSQYRLSGYLVVELPNSLSRKLVNAARKRRSDGVSYAFSHHVRTFRRMFSLLFYLSRYLIHHFTFIFRLIKFPAPAPSVLAIIGSRSSPYFRKGRIVRLIPILQVKILHRNN